MKRRPEIRFPDEPAPAAKRPAPKQVAEAVRPAAASVSREDARRMRDLYGNARDGGPEHEHDEPAHRRAATTRCRPKRDSGATAGDAAGQHLFCIDFARV